MTETLKWLCFMVEGGAVQRFHTRPGLAPYTDAAHSHGVAMLCHKLTQGRASSNLLMAALVHDLGEQYSGDVSAPAKRALGLGERLKAAEDLQLARYGLLFNLTAYEEHVLSVADQFEGLLWCCRERFMGNTTVNLMYDKWQLWCRQLTLTDTEYEVLTAIRELWGRAVGDYGPGFDVFEEKE